METSVNSFEKTKIGRKGLFAVVIIAVVVMLCTVLLSVTAFAGNAGEGLFNALFGNANQAVLQEDNPESYPFEAILKLGDTGSESNEEVNEPVKITVSYTNNYSDDDAKEKLTTDKIFYESEGEPFSFSTTLEGQAHGAPTVVNIDTDAITYEINPTTYEVTFKSEIGITKDANIEIRYGDEVTSYNIMYFYQGPDGDWRADPVPLDPKPTGKVYSEIPTQEQVESGMKQGFSLDTYDFGVALPGGIGFASVYYARDVNTVVFDNNGGVNGPGTIFARSGNTFNVQDQEPTRGGYEFDGWWTSPEEGKGEQIDVSKGYEVTTEKEVKFYAHWTLLDPENKYVTVTYWGQNADLIDESDPDKFDVDDYSIISEAYFDQQKCGEKFVIDTDDGLRPQTGGISTPRTYVTQIDTDNDGTLDKNIGECYSLTLDDKKDASLNAKVDGVKEIQADNYTVYNVYLKRIKYTWEFYDSAQYYNKKWYYGNALGTITARWGRSLATTDYENIRSTAYPNNPNQCSWVASYNGRNYQYVGFLNHMGFGNRKSTNTGTDDNAFGAGSLNSSRYFYYYLQNLDADDDPSNLNNYTQACKVGVSWNSSYGTEDWINIEGYVTPTPDTAYSPGVGDGISNNDKFFYKRQENDLFLYYIGTTKTSLSDNYWAKTSYNDYEKIIGDIQVPQEAKGTFPGAPQGDRSLKYFVPENPQLDNMDKNYVFGGWGLSPLPDSPTVDVNELKMGTSAYTLYAKWVPPKQTVTFTQVKVPKTEEVSSTIVLQDQTYNQKLKGTIPTAEEFENFYFQYWYYYVDDDAKEAGQRTYFDPYNSPVPPYDITLFPEYSSLEPNTEFLVKPVNKPDKFHGSIEPDTLFYVQKDELFTKADEEALEIKEWDFASSEFVTHTITPAPQEGYEFSGWKITFTDDTEYKTIEADKTKVTGACGVRAVFLPKEEVQLEAIPPVALEGVEYSAKPQTIAVPGEGRVEGGTMMYMVNQDPDDHGDKADYKTAIDEKTDVGTYYVHYYAKADEDTRYLDSEIGCVEASIAKMTIVISPVYVVKHIEPGEDEPTITGGECYDATSKSSAFNKGFINCIGESSKPISIKGKLFQERYSGWLTQYTWTYTDTSIGADNLEFIVNDTDMDYSVLYVTTDYVEVPKPAWIEDLVYTGEEYDLSIQTSNYFDNYSSYIMDLTTDSQDEKSTIKAKEIGTYNVVFHLHDGLIWEGETEDVRDLKVNWKIKSDQPEPTVTPPTPANHFIYDDQDHQLIAEPATITEGSGTIYYASAFNSWDEPTDGWTEDYTQVTGKNVGLYYIWYKVDDYEAKFVPEVGLDYPYSIDCLGAYAMYAEIPEQYREIIPYENELIIDCYDPKYFSPSPEEYDGFLGFIPQNVEYNTTDNLVPWHNYLGNLSLVEFGNDFKYWTHAVTYGDEPCDHGVAYMSNWFNGAAKLLSVIGQEKDFISNPGGDVPNYLVEGNDIFTGCINLLGGNGSSITTMNATGKECLRVDCYWEQARTALVPHYGLLTSSENIVNFVYDYNYDSEEEPPLLNRQMVVNNQGFTVGGVENNCGPVPTRSGYEFKGWQIDGDDNIYQPGQNYLVRSFVSEGQEQVTFKAVWEQNITPPTMIDDFWYDDNNHSIVDQPGSVEEGTISYYVSNDSINPPVKGWVTDPDEAIANMPGEYYLWYRVDDGEPKVVVDDEGNPDVCRVLSIFGLYIGDPSPVPTYLPNTLIILEYQGGTTPDEDPTMSSLFKGYVPTNVEYEKVADVPWYDVMNQIKYVQVTDNIQHWTKAAGTTHYVSNWFNGASNLLRIDGPEFVFVNAEDGNLLVSGTNVFAGCDNLLGGNGSSIASKKTVDADGFHEDYYTTDDAPVKHDGYLTYGYSLVNFKYDYNGGQGDIEVPLDRQKVDLSKAFTVGGVENAFASVPTKEGYDFAGWKVDGSDLVYKSGNVLPVMNFARWSGETVTFVAQWTEVVPEVTTKPVKGDDFWFDTNSHELFSVAGEAVGGILEYNYGINQSEYPTDTWVDNVSNSVAWEPGTYYLWYRLVDKSGAVLVEPTLLVDDLGNLETVTGYSAAAYYNTADKSLTISGFVDYTDKNLYGFLPRGLEITADKMAEYLPWNSIMGTMQHVKIDASLSDWLEEYNGTKAYMTNWFNGAENVIDIVADDEMFYDDGVIKVQGSDVFVNCKSLIGGNGTTFANKKDTGLTYLYNDYVDVTRTVTDHEGYLTPTTGLNVKYDYNGGSGEPETPLTNQKVNFSHHFTVTGYNSTFAAEPTKDGFEFAGWKYNDTTYYTGNNVSALFPTKEDPITEITLVAQWEQTEKQDQVVTTDVTQNLYVGEFGRVEVRGIQDKPTMEWEINDDPAKIEWDSDTHTFVGYFKAISGGTAHVTLHIAETDNFNACDVEIEFEIIGKIVDNVQLESMYTLSADQSLDVEATGISDGRRVTWSVVSGDEFVDIKYVNNNPVLVKGIAVGQAVIKILVEESIQYAAVEKTTVINVGDKLDQEITFEIVPGEVHVGEYGGVIAKGAKDKPDYAWEIVGGESEVLEIVSVTDTSTVNFHGLKAGTAQLKLTVGETPNYKEKILTIDVTILDKVEQDIAFDQDLYEVRVGKNINITAKGLSEGRNISWEVVDGGDYVALEYVRANPVRVDGVTPGIATLKITAAEDETYAESSATVQVKVNPKPQQQLTFDKESLTLDPGDTDTVTVSGILENADFVWSILDNEIATIDGATDYAQVKVNGLSFGTTKLVITVEETETYAETVAQLNVTVNNADFVLLKNRDEVTKLSIIDQYKAAKSVQFTHEAPATYYDRICIDNNNVGLIYAYKILNEDQSIDVKIVSASKIASNTTSMAGLFKNFTNLESVDFGDLILDHATTMQSMFNHCTSLQIVDLSSSADTGFNTSNVTSFAYMFSNESKKITNINIGMGFTVQSTADLTDMFNGCTSLYCISVPQGTDWRNGTGSSSNMFKDCKNLPNYNKNYLDRIKAYCDGYGYFTATDNHKLLKGRVNGTNSIIQKYNEAVSVEFSHAVPAKYESCINVDAEDKGYIKAYQVKNDDGTYGVVIASQYLIGAGPTSFEGIFKHFEKLISVDFGDVSIDKASSLKVMFSGCKSIERVNFESTAEGGFDTSNVTNFAWMFNDGCAALTTVTFGKGFVVDASADLTDMFYNCRELSSIIVEKGTDWSQGSGPSSGMFYECKKLPNWDQKVINRAKAHCNQGGYFSTEDGDINMLKNRPGTGSVLGEFKDATSVEFSHTVPASYQKAINVDVVDKGVIKAYQVEDTNGGYRVVVASDDQIGVNTTSFEGIFKYFKKLKSVDFGDIVLDNAQSLKVMFSGCSALETVEFKSTATTGFNTSNVTNFDCMFNDGCTALTSVTLGFGFDASDTATLNYMFEGCKALNSIIVEEGTDWSKGTGSSQGMFSSCNNLPGFDKSKVTRTKAHCNEGGYFSVLSGDTYYLKNRPNAGSILGSNSDATSVTFTHTIPTDYIDAMNVDELDKGLIKAYKVDDGNQGYKIIVASEYNIAVNDTSFEGIFKYFAKLTSVDFGDVIVDRAKSFKVMFAGCSRLSNVNLSSTASSGFNTSNVNDFSFMFKDGCTALNTVTFGDGFVVKGDAALSYMFDGCTALATIKVKSGTDWRGSGDGTGMFIGCSKLPNYDPKVVDRSRAYCGDGGYFTASNNRNILFNMMNMFFHSVVTGDFGDDPVVNKQQEVTVDVPENIYVGELGKLEVSGIQENPDMEWEITDDPAKFEWDYETHTYIACFRATEAGMAHATLHIGATENYEATDVEVEFEIHGKIEEEIQLEDMYTLSVDSGMDVEASGISAGRRVTWSVVSGEDFVDIKYVNNNPVLVKGIAKGQATIKISVDESIYYAASEKTTVINVGDKLNQNITFNVTPDVYVGEYGSITAVGAQEKPDFTWEISGGDAGVIEFVKDSTTNIVNYKGLKGGTAQVKVSISETPNYNATEYTVDVPIIAKIVQNITFDKDLYEVNIGKSIDIKANGLKEGRDVTWEVIEGNDNVLLNYVNSNPVRVNGIKVGNATIKITAAESQYYAETSATIPVKVNVKPQQPLTFDKDSVTLDPGDTDTVTVSNIKENASFTWSIYDEDVAKITGVTDYEQVKVDAISPGNTKLAITVEETESYSETVVELNLTVNDVDYALLKNRDEATKLSIINAYSNAKTVEFTHEIPAQYKERIVIDNNEQGLIYAYKIVNDDSSVDVKIASASKIAANKTSLAGIFKNFTNLESVDFGDLIVSHATTMQSMFNHCPKLLTVDLSSTAEDGFNTSNVTSFAYMFSAGNIKLTNINLGLGFVVKGTADITDMFNGCKALNCISVPEGTDWREGTGSSTGLFKDCNNLPNFNPTYIERIKAYYGGYGYFTLANDVKLLKGRVDGTKSIIEAYKATTSVVFTHNIPLTYEECINVDAENKGFIKAYKIMNDDGSYRVEIASQYQMGSGPTSLEGMFKNFTNLQHVDFGDITVDKAASMKVMFSGCSSLERVNFESTSEGGFDTSNVTNFAYMFNGGCKALSTVTIGNGFVVDNNADLTSMFENCDLLASIIVEKGTDWSQGSGPSLNMFYNCPSLPNWVDSATDRRKAHCNEGGYFSTLDDELCLLVNRPGSDSILGGYSDATSVVFSHTIPTSYISCMNVDVENRGDIKAYQIDEGKGTYRVVVASEKKIGVNATSFEGIFKGWTNLKNVDFGDVVVDNALSLKVMFNGCSALEHVELKSTAATGFNTSNVTNYQYMFYDGCTSLTSITLGPGFNVMDTAVLNNMFGNCTALHSIFVEEGTDWSKGSGSSYEMFINCKNLPGFNSSEITRTKAHCNAGGYFTASTGSVYRLKNRPSGSSIIGVYSEASSVAFTHTIPTDFEDVINVDDADKGLIKAYKVSDGSGGYKVIISSQGDIAVNESSFEGIFKNFTNLTSVDFGDIILDNAKSMKVMFNGCSKLASVDLSSAATTGFNTSNVVDFSYMFKDVGSALTSINLGDGFEVNGNAYLTLMFDNCPALSAIKVKPGTDWSKGTVASDGMFNGCIALPNFNPGKTDRTNAHCNTGGYFTSTATKDSYLLKNRPSGQSIIENYSGATSVSFGHTVPSTYLSSINVDTLNEGTIKAYQVSDDNGGYKVVIVSNQTILVNETSFEGMFKNFVNLKNVDFGDVVVDNAKSFKVMFSGCRSLTSVNFNSSAASGFNTSNVLDYSWMFNGGCTSLKTVTFGTGFVMSKAAVLTAMFDGCSLLSTINVRQNASNWSDGTGDSTAMFNGCTSLANYSGSKIDRTYAHAGNGGYFTLIS